MKLVSSNMVNTLSFIAINGPTFDNASIAPFSWSTALFAKTTPHMGLTDTYKFGPVQVNWNS